MNGKLKDSRPMKLYLYLLLFLATLFQYHPVQAKESISPLKEDAKQVKTWNQFADRLYQLHKHLLRGKQVRITEKTGGYGGVTGPRDFYVEKKYFDKTNNRLLSRIQWEKDNPDTIHVIEVFIYDEHGRVQRDYLAAYLPGFRNAPIQTLINLHSYNDGLHAFRQFDASGERIYERCSGGFFDETVNISLEDYQLSPYTPTRPAVMDTEAYLACFQGVSTSADAYLDPINEFRNTRAADSGDDAFLQISQLSEQIQRQPDNATLYVQRGNAYFNTHQFASAVADFEHALMLDDSLDEAYFGRGMATGRQGKFKQAIADMSVYLQRNPSSSRGYTKRGVRYIWAKQLQKARHDLQQAVLLDNTNSEAHDDLGVLMAQAGEHDLAVQHFHMAIEHDPSYQKAYHNLALVYLQLGENSRALQAVDKALQLAPTDRNALLLKSEILQQHGRPGEAAELRERAEFLPQGNWSERFHIQ
jgi:tetratricopeptide (TPR) repeat protein